MASALSSAPPATIAIDLGAQSCRVSLLTWEADTPSLELVHRFAHAPVTQAHGLTWDLERICREVDAGVAVAAERGHSIASIGIDGWAVDYVRLSPGGEPLHAPFCYRDKRNEDAEAWVHARVSAAELFAYTGVQPLRINTLYQLVADARAGIPATTPWVNLPEYMLSRYGAPRVSEYSNATHTGLLSGSSRAWCSDIFEACGLAVAAAPSLVSPGTLLGQLSGHMAELPGLRGAQLIAPATHDTASAVASITLEGGDWAYLSSGTWSLVGTPVEKPILAQDAFAKGFTNFGGVGGKICFHKNVNGMWLLKECLDPLCGGPGNWTMQAIIREVERLPRPAVLIDVDDAALLQPGPLAPRINQQLLAAGGDPIAECAASAPAFANLIFHSLAARYSSVLGDVKRLSGKPLRRLVVVGGGSLNRYLNQLTAEATGLAVSCGGVESSTLGNFAVQLATLEGLPNVRERIRHWAALLAHVAP